MTWHDRKPCMGSIWKRPGPACRLLLVGMARWTNGQVLECFSALASCCGLNIGSEGSLVQQCLSPPCHWGHIFSQSLANEVQRQLSLRKEGFYSTRQITERLSQASGHRQNHTVFYSSALCIAQVFSLIAQNGAPEPRSSAP